MAKRGEVETRNARIESTFLGIEDHGMFTFILNLDYDGSGQGFGLCTLGDRWHGCELLQKVLETVGVDSWEQLKGKYIRARSDWSKVYAIAHITKNNWLDIEDFWEENSDE